MKRIKFPLFFLAIGIAIASVFAFIPAKEKNVNKATFSRYYYDGPSTQTIAQLSDPLNWEDSGPSCEVSGSDVCSISYPGTRNDFDTYISSFADDTKQDVMNVADGFKN